MTTSSHCIMVEAILWTRTFMMCWASTKMTTIDKIDSVGGSYTHQRKYPWRKASNVGTSQSVTVVSVYQLARAATETLMSASEGCVPKS